MTPGIVDADDSAEGRRDATTAVLRSIVALLSPHAPSDKTAWLAERLRLLEDATTPRDVLATTMSELHRVVPGMGGLTDIYLDAGTPEATERANAELLRLANQLYSLTEA